MDTPKRVVPGAAFNVNISKLETASASTGMGSKLKSVKNSFRTVVTEKVKLRPNQASIYVASPPHIPDGPSRPVRKTRICSKCYEAEGCNFGDKCHFAHGKGELGKPIFLDDNALPSSDFAGQLKDSSPPSSLDVPFTAKISVDASLAGAIIGNGIVNSKKICLETDVEPLIQVHESDLNLRDIELKGNFEQVKMATAMVIELIGNMGKSSVSLVTLDIDNESLSPSSTIQPSLNEMGKKNLYLVVYICTEEYMYALYRIGITDFNDYLPLSNSSPVPLCEPVLLLGREFPFGMAFFAFGSRIYILGSGGTYRSRNVYVFDTVTGDFGYAYEKMLTYKFLPRAIQPLKPFDDRVFVLSNDRCGHDLEVFYPDRQKNSWTFIGGPSWWTYPPGCLIDSHSTVLDGFLLLTSNGVILFYNIPSDTWTFRMDSHTYFILEPCVFAYEIGKWFSYCVNQAKQDDLVGFLCSYSINSMSMHGVGKSPLLQLSYHPAPCEFYSNDNLLYLGNFWFCLVRSGFDTAGRWHYSDPLPKLHATVSLFCVDPFTSSILGEQSSSYEINQFNLCDDARAYVYASFVI